MPPRVVLSDKVVNLYIALGRTIQDLARNTEAGSAAALAGRHPHLPDDTIVNKWAKGTTRPQIQGIADWAQVLGFDNILGLLKAAGWGDDADRESVRPDVAAAIRGDDRIDPETRTLLLRLVAALGPESLPKPVKTASRRHRKN